MISIIFVNVIIYKKLSISINIYYIIYETKNNNLIFFIYLTVLPKPTVNVKNGTFDLWNVQYHVANVAANTISPNADIKNTTQKKPITFIA